MMSDLTKTRTDRLVDEIMTEAREAIYRRALKHAKGDVLTERDVCEAGRRLFLDGRWPQNLIDTLL